MKGKKFEAIKMDYGKNVPIPNITTGEVYYKIQLSSYHLINVLVISNSPPSTFYNYDQSKFGQVTLDKC